MMRDWILVILGLGIFVAGIFLYRAGCALEKIHKSSNTKREDVD